MDYNDEEHPYFESSCVTLALIELIVMLASAERSHELMEKMIMSRSHVNS
jgi:hypothetical protein